MIFSEWTADWWLQCDMQKGINKKPKLWLVRPSWIGIKGSRLLVKPVLHCSHVLSLIKEYLIVTAAMHLKNRCKIKWQGWLLCYPVDCICDKMANYTTTALIHTKCHLGPHFVPYYLFHFFYRDFWEELRQYLTAAHQWGWYCSASENK